MRYASARRSFFVLLAYHHFHTVFVRIASKVSRHRPHDVLSYWDGLIVAEGVGGDRFTSKERVIQIKFHVLDAPFHIVRFRSEREW